MYRVVLPEDSFVHRLSAFATTTVSIYTAALQHIIVTAGPDD